MAKSKDKSEGLAAEEALPLALEPLEAVSVVLLTNHTHEGKKLPKGAEITTYRQQARWMELMRIAEVKKTTTKEQ